jgi:hypothetical protein
MINSSMSMARKSPAARTYRHHRHHSVVSESILVHDAVRVVWGGVVWWSRTKTSNTQRPPSPWAEQGREARLHPFDHQLRTQSCSLNGKKYTVPRTRSCVCNQNDFAGWLCQRVRSRSPVNNHFMKIVCCMQQSSLEQGLCLGLLYLGAPCRCLCKSCGSVCLCEHGLRFLKFSPLRWQLQSIKAMA